MFLILILILLLLGLLIIGIILYMNSKRTVSIQAVTVGKSAPSVMVGSSYGDRVRNYVGSTNQFSCNSCWAIATSQAVSDRLHLKGLIPLNDQLNYYAYHDMIVNRTPDEDGCVLGAYLETGMNSFNIFGAPLMSQTSDRQFDDKPVQSDLSVKRYTTNGWKNLSGSSIDTIKKEIDTNGTVVATMNIYDSFDNFNGDGIYTPLPGESADQSMLHMISIIGYDNTDQTWIIRNSYGSNWGHNGLVKIRWNDPKMNIEDYVYAPIV